MNAILCNEEWNGMEWNGMEYSTSGARKPFCCLQNVASGSETNIARLARQEASTRIKVRKSPESPPTRGGEGLPARPWIIIEERKEKKKITPSSAQTGLAAALDRHGKSADAPG
mmetsp:Transcript_22291/g.35861  ORF Transcript_22291/g.35861 Transcript_22291/m.35861 type:complete len:114 (+) Transcript_22291:578-919(+)